MTTLPVHARRPAKYTGSVVFANNYGYINVPTLIRPFPASRPVIHRMRLLLSYNTRFFNPYIDYRRNFHVLSSGTTIITVTCRDTYFSLNYNKKKKKFSDKNKKHTVITYAINLEKNNNYNNVTSILGSVFGRTRLRTSSEWHTCVLTAWSVEYEIALFFKKKQPQNNYLKCFQF